MKKRLPARAWGICLALILVLLSGCSLPQINLPNFSLPNLGRAPAADADTPIPEATVVAGQEISAAPEPELAAEAPALVDSRAPGYELRAADLEAEGASGLILFTSAAEQPFAALDVAPADLPYAERHLFAFSVDGARAGRISPPGFGAALQPAQPPAAGSPAMLQYGLQFSADGLEAILAPELCGWDAERAFDPADPPCGGFQISPDRRYLAFFSGPDSCGRALQVLDLRAGQVVRTIEGARWAHFQQNSTLMLASGDCETARTGVYIPHQNTYAGTGLDGVPYWNPARSAVLFQVAAGGGARPALWGFNLQTSKVILWMDDDHVLQDLPAWTPDGETFLFQHRRVRYDQSSRMLVIEGPRQIVRMNAATRSQQQLTPAGRYEYHLCEQDGAPCDQWYGDFVQVRRTPYRPAALQYDPAAGQFADPEAARCALSGLDCAEPGELFALNWKTGALIPWDEADLPAPSSAALPAEPDYAHGPLYEDPSGSFAFYPGRDGRSLYRVEPDGYAELWVQDGQDFIYVP